LLTSVGMFGALEHQGGSAIVGVNGTCMAGLGEEVRYYGSPSHAILAHLGLANEIGRKNTFMQGTLEEAEGIIDSLPINIE